MSLTIVAINKTCDNMIIISDKRVTGFTGKIKHYTGDDTAIKHHIINDRICFLPGYYITADNKPAQRLTTLLQFANYPSDQLIKMVAAMDRSYTGTDGALYHDQVILCGLNDQDKFFILGGQPDGSFCYQSEVPDEYKLTIVTNGEHLHEPAMTYLASLIKKGSTLLQSLIKTVKFVASIERTVSKTYNYTIIKR